MLWRPSVRNVNKEAKFKRKRWELGVISGCRLFLWTGKMTQLIIMDNFKTREQIYWTTTNNKKKVSTVMSGSLPDEKGRRKWVDFVLLMRFHVLRKLMWWESLKLGWCLNLPPNKIPDCFSKCQKPGIWYIMNLTGSVSEVTDCGLASLGSVPCGRTST
jgi:hypothetical protein